MAEAKAILEEAHFNFSKTYQVGTWSGIRLEAAATFVMEQLSLLGIKYEFPDHEGITGLEKWDPDDFLFVPTYMAYDDPNSVAREVIRCESLNPTGPGLNRGACEANLVALIERVEDELDPAKRLELAHQIELAAMKDYSSLPVYWRKRAASFWPEVRGYAHSLHYHGSFRKFMHMWIDPAHKNDAGNASQTTGVPGGM